MKTVFVYQDYVHPNEVLLSRLRETFGAETVRRCDASDIIGGCLNQDVHMFVMPGGADLLYYEKLNGAGNKAIRSYIEEGGFYLGICAGAYYACRRIEWARDDPDYAICQDRELEFFAGTAVGPVYDWLEDHDITKSWDQVVELDTAHGFYSTLYSAGPMFVPDTDSTHHTLASFKNLPENPASIVEIAVGKGRVILSSPHIEFSPEKTTAALLESVRVRACDASREWSEQVCKDFSNAAHTNLWERFIPPLLCHSDKQAA